MAEGHYAINRFRCDFSMRGGGVTEQFIGNAQLVTQTFVSDWHCFAQWKSSKSPAVPLKEPREAALKPPHPPPILHRQRGYKWTRLCWESQHVETDWTSRDIRPAPPSDDPLLTAWRWLLAVLEYTHTAGCVYRTETRRHGNTRNTKKHKDWIYCFKCETSLWIYHNMIILTWLFFFVFFSLPSNLLAETESGTVKTYKYSKKKKKKEHHFHCFS